MKKALIGAGYRVGKVRHVIWSPSQDEWGPERFRDGGKAFREAFKRTLKARTHYYGGAFILHCERKKHTDGTECEEKRCRKKHIWVWGPHIHYVGWGYFDNSGEVHQRTGWVYKVVEDQGPRNVYETVRYQLSHATIFPDQGRQMLVRYIGMATWGRKEKVGSHREVLTCSICGEEMRKVGDYHGHLDLSIDLGPAVVRKNEYRYLVRVRGRKKRVEQHRFGLDLHEGNT